MRRERERNKLAPGGRISQVTAYFFLPNVRSLYLVLMVVQAASFRSFSQEACSNCMREMDVCVFVCVCGCPYMRLKSGRL